jgi:hypothetical protein
MKYRKNINFTEKMGVGCVFRVQKIKEDGTITYDGPEFHNVVLDQALDAMRNTPIHDLTQRLHVGTNGSAVFPTNTGLLEPVSYLQDIGYTYGGEAFTSLPYTYKRREWYFPVGTVNGDLKELGLSSTGDFFFNRQLFKDIYGNPTTITVASDEGLRVFTEIRLYGDINITEEEVGSFLFTDETASTSGTINFTRSINGDAFTNTSTSYSMLHGYYRDVFSDAMKMFIDNSTTGFTTNNRCNSITLEDYVDGSHESVCECYWDANSYSGDINSISTGHDCRYNTAISTFYLDTPINISENEELRFTFKRSWGRYIP